MKEDIHWKEIDFTQDDWESAEYYDVTLIYNKGNRIKFIANDTIFECKKDNVNNILPVFRGK